MKLNSEKPLTVKRKFREGESSRQDRWWFLLRGTEAVLMELENLWSDVTLQTGWKLEKCTKPSDRDDAINVDGAQNESPAINEQEQDETPGATIATQSELNTANTGVHHENDVEQSATIPSSRSAQSLTHPPESENGQTHDQSFLRVNQSPCHPS